MSEVREEGVSEEGADAEVKGVPVTGAQSRMPCGIFLIKCTSIG